MQNLARRIVQRLDVDAQTHLWLAVDDEALATTLGSILAASGATLLEAPVAELSAAVLETETLEPRLLPESLTEALVQIPADARVVCLVRARAAGTSVEAYAEAQGRRLGLVHTSGLDVEQGTLLRGTRRAKPKGAQLRELRGIGHGIDPSVLVGRGGLTDEVLEAAAAAVARHGLVKVKLTPQCSLDKREAAKALAWATGSDLVQRVGKTALLWRRDVNLEPPSKQKGRR
jgi:RNA-binding protein